MKKLFTLFTVMALLMSFVTFNCHHTHNSECGYDETTETGCTHTHDESCTPIDPLDIFDPDNPPH